MGSRQIAPTCTAAPGPKVTIQPDGKILVAGPAKRNSGAHFFVLAHCRAHSCARQPGSDLG